MDGGAWSSVPDVLVSCDLAEAGLRDRAERVRVGFGFSSSAGVSCVSFLELRRERLSTIFLQVALMKRELLVAVVRSFDRSVTKAAQAPDGSESPAVGVWKL